MTKSNNLNEEYTDDVIKNIRILSQWIKIETICEQNIPAFASNIIFKYSFHFEKSIWDHL